LLIPAVHITANFQSIPVRQDTGFVRAMQAQLSFLIVMIRYARRPRQ
jgi:hypothetical protein